MSNKQILKLLKTKIEHYSKIRDKNKAGIILEEESK